jgi:hypothetical protein
MDPAREAALQILARTNIWKSNYAPPATRLLWRLGFNVPPPHFASFTSIVFSFGLYFGTALGLLMWLFPVSMSGSGGCVLIVPSTLAGLLFGVSMATYYAYGRKRHRLPTWSELRERTKNDA